VTITLLDETDRTQRRLQHGAVLGGIVLLASTLALLDPPGRRPWALVTAATGLALLAVAMRIDQRWTVTHKGHQVRFVNNPMRGEKLFIDDAHVASGKLGIRSEIRGAITHGDGIGDVVVVRTVARLLTFRCRIDVEPADSGGVPRGVSDAALLDEVRRRGLG
jgi:hypothetical protein